MSHIPSRAQLAYAPSISGASHEIGITNIRHAEASEANHLKNFSPPLRNLLNHIQGFGPPCYPMLYLPLMRGEHQIFAHHVISQGESRVSVGLQALIAPTDLRYDKFGYPDMLATCQHLAAQALHRFTGIPLSPDIFADNPDSLIFLELLGQHPSLDNPEVYGIAGFLTIDDFDDILPPNNPRIAAGRFVDIEDLLDEHQSPQSSTRLCPWSTTLLRRMVWGID